MHLDLVWAFHGVRGEGDCGSERTGTVCVGFPEDSQVGVHARGTGKAWKAFQRKWCVQQSLKVQQELVSRDWVWGRLESCSGTCKVKDEESSRKEGMLENKQGERMVEGLEVILRSSHFLPRTRGAIPGS